MTQALSRVRQAAKGQKEGAVHRTSHHINADTLRTAFFALQRKAAPGVDGVTWQDYEADLDPISRTSTEGSNGSVSAATVSPDVPTEGGWSAKAAGDWSPGKSDRPGRCVMVLNAIYEENFLGFSYGFRPGRGPHHGLDALSVAITSRQVNDILDADVRDFFGSVSQDWLVSFLEHRVGDKRIIRLIRKWLKVGHPRRRDRNRS